MAGSAQHIRVVLDVSETKLKISGPADMLRVWGELERQIVGRTMVKGQRERLLAQSQPVFLEVVSNNIVDAKIQEDTQFEIISIAEKADIKYACATCLKSGQETYGPFICVECQNSGSQSRICDDHVVIIDSSNKSFCPTHHPKCSCGENADFWCHGPGCKGNRSWCLKHGLKNSRASDEVYCRDCFGELFPDCDHHGCKNIGSLKCEFIEPNGQSACGKAGCSKHMSRWQVFGPQTEGIVLCEEHRSRRYLDPRDLVADVFRSTAWRNSKSWRIQNLPTLQSFRHVLRQKMHKNFEVAEVSALFDHLPLPNSGNRKYTSAASELLKRYEEQRKKLVRKNEDELLEGRRIFQRLLSALIEMGQDELASVIRFSDYRPRNTRLFVVVPEEYRGLFIGARGKNINDLKVRVGVSIDIEKSR